MSRNRIGWLAIGLPAMLVGAFEFFRHRWLEHQLPGLWGNVIGALIVAAGVYGFIRYFTVTVALTERDLGRSRAEAAVLAERQRIAREMHDNVAQALFHVRVRLQEMDKHAVRGELPEVRQEITSLQGQISAVYAQVRAVISDLKQQAESEETGEALRRGATKVAQELGLDLQITLAEVPQLDGKGQQHLLAIISEAMTNARRHGGATGVQLSADPARLLLVDNGLGFDPRRNSTDGFGMMIMAERARMLGGELAIQSAPGRGARITLYWEANSCDDPTLDC